MTAIDTSILDAVHFRALRLLTVEELRRIDPQTVDSFPYSGAGVCALQQATGCNGSYELALARGLQPRTRAFKDIAVTACHLTNWNDRTPYSPAKRAELSRAVAAAIAEKEDAP